MTEKSTENTSSNPTKRKWFEIEELRHEVKRTRKSTYTPYELGSPWAPPRVPGAYKK